MVMSELVVVTEGVELVTDLSCLLSRFSLKSLLSRLKSLLSLLKSLLSLLFSILLSLFLSPLVSSFFLPVSLWRLFIDNDWLKGRLLSVVGRIMATTSATTVVDKQYINSDLEHLFT